MILALFFQLGIGKPAAQGFGVAAPVRAPVKVFQRHLCKIFAGEPACKIGHAVHSLPQAVFLLHQLVQIDDDLFRPFCSLRSGCQTLDLVCFPLQIGRQDLLHFCHLVCIIGPDPLTGKVILCPGFCPLQALIEMQIGLQGQTEICQFFPLGFLVVLSEMVCDFLVSADGCIQVIDPVFVVRAVFLKGACSQLFQGLPHPVNLSVPVKLLGTILPDQGSRPFVTRQPADPLQLLADPIVSDIYFRG